jgi:Ca2+-binding EF-hand superfamily protein
MFIKELDNGNLFNEKDIDSLMEELDQKQMGFLGYEDFVYGLMPK